MAAVTKSGTNEFHGSLFEFVRNDLFNAREYFSTTNSTLKRNQFGGTVGGPIVRDKLFFFGGYQGTTLREDASNRRVYIPTAAMRNGDFRTFASRECQGRRALTLGAPFVDNQVDPELFSPAAMFILNWDQAPMPFPTTDDPCGEITYGDMNRRNQSHYVTKVDYQASDKHSMLFRMVNFFDDVPRAVDVGFNTNLLQRTMGIDTSQSAYAFGSTYLINPNTVQSFRLSVGRSRVLFKNTEIFDYCDAGVNIYCDPRASDRNWSDD